MKGRFIIAGFGLSGPGTMGGNSKIALEIARHLPSRCEVHLVVPEGKVGAVGDASGSPKGLVLHRVASFPGNDKYRPIASSLHFTRELFAVLREIGAGPGDIVYCASDFHVDIVPAFAARREFGCRWIGVLFLFVPSVWENLAGRLGFPVARYALYWLYQRSILAMLRSADAVVITNESDRPRLPGRLRGKSFAFLGGVNLEDIPSAPVPKRYDAVFCSRLHPQKGLMKFLDAWRIVVSARPDAKLAVIGNGERKYEEALRRRARALGIDGSIEWLGYVNGPEKFAVYRASRLFVHPTVFDNNGMVAAEALAAGLPVVMTDLPALRNVYREGCRKVERGRPEAFASAVLDILANPEAAAPSPPELAALRARWSWEARVGAFSKWLEEVFE